MLLSIQVSNPGYTFPAVGNTNHIFNIAAIFQPRLSVFVCFLLLAYLNLSDICVWLKHCGKQLQKNSESG